MGMYVQLLVRMYIHITVVMVIMSLTSVVYVTDHAVQHKVRLCCCSSDFKLGKCSQYK
jgi:hypothetical protein